MTRKHMIKCSKSSAIRQIEPERNIIVHQSDFLSKIDHARPWQQGRKTGWCIRCWWDQEIVQYSYSGRHFDSLFFKNTKHATTIQPSNCTSGHLSQRNENLCPPEPVLNVYSPFACKGPKLEAVQMSFKEEWLTNHDAFIL